MINRQMDIVRSIEWLRSLYMCGDTFKDIIVLLSKMNKNIQRSEERSNDEMWNGLVEAAGWIYNELGTVHGLALGLILCEWVD